MSEYNYAHFTRTQVEDDDFPRFKTALTVGEQAPDGELVDASTGDRVRLSQLWATDALVLEFGSIT